MAQLALSPKLGSQGVPTMWAVYIPLMQPSLDCCWLVSGRDLLRLISFKDWQWPLTTSLWPLWRLSCAGAYSAEQDLPLQGSSAHWVHPLSVSLVEVVDGGALMWCVANHWVYKSWGLLGGAGQGQPPLCSFWGHPNKLQSHLQLAATCAGLGGSQVSPSCKPRLAAVSAGPRAT